MNQSKYYPPIYKGEAFNCPHCEVYAEQVWNTVYGASSSGSYKAIKKTDVSVCVHCDSFSIWLRGNLLYPSVSPIPQPHEDLPADCKIERRSKEYFFSFTKGSSSLIEVVCAEITNSSRLHE